MSEPSIYSLNEELLSLGFKWEKPREIHVTKEVGTVKGQN